MSTSSNRGPRYGVGELLLKATPLILCGVGLAIGFRANVNNIGADGQLTMGAIAAGAVALYFDEVQAWWVLPLMLLAGALGGMLWAAIPALLRTRFNTSEILVSLMLVYVSYHLLSYLVHGPMRDPAGFNFPQSKMFSESATLPLLVEGLRVNAAFILSLLAAGAAWFFCKHSFAGYRMQVSGMAPAPRCTRLQRAAQCVAGLSWSAVRCPALPAWAKWRGRWGSCSRRCRRATASRRSSWRMWAPASARRGAVGDADVAAVHRRRDGADRAASAVRHHRHLPGPAAVLSAGR
jgi:hypothetical protein